MSTYRQGGFQALPPVVKNLLIINVIMVVLQLVLFSSFRIDIQNYLALYYWRSDLFKPWQLITHMFMHGSSDPRRLQETVLHIVSNMFALWMFGTILENRFGSKRFLTFYFICGIGAALCQMGVMAIQVEPIIKSFGQYQQNATLDHFNQFMNQYFITDKMLKPGAGGYVSDKIKDFYNIWNNNPSDLSFVNQSKSVIYDYLYGMKLSGVHQQGYLDDGMVGASGAVFGVLFAFGYLFPNTELMLLFPPIPIKAKWLIAGYMVFELYAGIRNSATDNVAHFAHLGGALFAFLILKIWQQQARRRSY